VLRRGGEHLAAHADPMGVAADVDLLLRRLLE